MSARLLVPALLLALLGARAPAGEVTEGYLTLPEGHRLFYVKAGGGARTVILPGRLFTFRDFRWLAEDFTLIAYDMRSRGRSDLVVDGQRLRLEDDVADLEAVRRHFGVERFSAIGYSYLGKVAALYAIAHPDRVERLVQLGPVPMVFGTRYAAGLEAARADTNVTAEDRARLKGLREKDYHLTHPQEYCDEEWAAFRKDLLGDPARVAALGPSVCDMPNEWPILLVRHMRFAFEGSAMTHVLPRDAVSGLRIPVLTVHGTRDRNAPYGAGREWAFVLPEGRLLSIPGAAHQAFAEHPETVMPAVKEFLAGRWPKAAENVARDPRIGP